MSRTRRALQGLAAWSRKFILSDAEKRNNKSKERNEKVSEVKAERIWLDESRLSTPLVHPSIILSIFFLLQLSCAKKSDRGVLRCYFFPLFSTLFKKNSPVVLWL